MTDDELRDLAERIYRVDFHKDLGDTVVRVNGRLSRAAGQEYLDYRDSRYHIDVARYAVEEFPRVLIIGIIRHELCHLYLEPRHLKRAHGKVFKALLKRVGGVYYVPLLMENYQPSHKLYIYKCHDCGHVYYLKRRNHGRYLCRCAGFLEPVGWITERTYLQAFLYQQSVKPGPYSTQVKVLDGAARQTSLF